MTSFLINLNILAKKCVCYDEMKTSDAST